MSTTRRLRSHTTPNSNVSPSNVDRNLQNYLLVEGFRSPTRLWRLMSDMEMRARMIRQGVWAGIAMIVLGSVACSTNRPGSATGETGGHPRTLCARPAEGCECEVGAKPVTCIPPEPDDSGECRVGTMYCRGGEWSECEFVRSYTKGSDPVGRTGSALVGDPDDCSTCSPGCAEATDTPNDTDLTGTNSVGVEYSPDEGGITLSERQRPSFRVAPKPPAATPPVVRTKNFAQARGRSSWSAIPFQATQFQPARGPLQLRRSNMRSARVKR